MNVDRCRRLGPWILASLLLAQVSLGIHKAQHASAPQDTQCVLCLSADHLGGPPAHTILHAVVVAHDEPTAIDEQPLAPTGLPSPYESRAPPLSS